jgi:putative ABC transport system ATP-binding protein
MRLELVGVTCSFTTHAPLFSGVDLCLESGEFVVLQGPSGSGKSSFLRLLNMLDAPAAGHLLFDGHPPHPEAAPDLRQRILLVPQTPLVRPGSVWETLIYPFSFRAARAKQIPQRQEMRRMLDRVLLTDLAFDEEAGKLSVGQRQRLGLVRALGIRPDFLLLDEPTAALDPEAAAAVESLLEEYCLEHGCGVVLVSHQPFSPRQIVPRYLRLAAGRLQEARS